MNNKIFVIMGKFASGKTTIARLLETRYGVKRVITCTTRAKREGERDGIDYYYFSDEEFEYLANNDKLAAINRVPEELNGASSLRAMTNAIRKVVGKPKSVKYIKKYGVPIDKVELDKYSYICVLEPSGYFDLVDKLGRDKVKAIYLNLSDKERWLRALNRELNPDVDDIVSKHMQEFELYNGIDERCDKVICNAGTSDEAAVEIYTFINIEK